MFLYAGSHFGLRDLLHVSEWITPGTGYNHPRYKHGSEVSNELSLQAKRPTGSDAEVKYGVSPVQR